MKNPEIVITGGPCSGKTTGMNYLEEKLADKGFRSLMVPEVATMIILSGLRDINEIAKQSPDKLLAIEESIFLTQLSLQKRYNDLAAVFPEGKRVVLYDRGIMDIMAYTGEDYFNYLLKKHGLNRIHARDSYDGVIHLRTAAIGAEKFYTTQNNKARRETLEEAITADGKTLAAWIGHPHLKVIDNSIDFEGKLKRAFRIVCKTLGIPVPTEIEKKYLLKARPDFHHPILMSAQKIFIEQMYLTSDDPTKEIRIRKRSQNGSNMYYQTVKTRIDEIERYETEFPIT
ncbi:MAG: AAA family ATPase, partial [Patescibacteria group bacterium]|nr:AAA family ATPase [Patescibacteria group bacterium]